MRYRAHTTDLLEAVIDCVGRAGAIVRGRDERLHPIQKSSSLGDVVTEVDTEVQKFLVSELQALLPDAGIIGEEDLDRPNLTRQWIIDPIDGTLNLIHGLSHVGISVALQEYGQTTLGVVCNPFTQDTYFATRGHGSYLQMPGSSSETPLHVSGIELLSNALVGFGLPYDRSQADRLFEAARRILSSCQDLRQRGSAALDIIAVAEARMDAHFEVDLWIWDIAAAELILREAGGALTNWEGGSIAWNRDTSLSVAASNGALHKELLRLLHEGSEATFKTS